MGESPGPTRLTKPAKRSGDWNRPRTARFRRCPGQDGPGRRSGQRGGRQGNGLRHQGSRLRDREGLGGGGQSRRKGIRCQTMGDANSWTFISTIQVSFVSAEEHTQAQRCLSYGSFFKWSSFSSSRTFESGCPTGSTDGCGSSNWLLRFSHLAIDLSPENRMDLNNIVRLQPVYLFNVRPFWIFWGVSGICIPLNGSEPLSIYVHIPRA